MLPRAREDARPVAYPVKPIGQARTWRALRRTGRARAERRRRQNTSNPASTRHARPGRRGHPHDVGPRARPFRVRAQQRRRPARHVAHVHAGDPVGLALTEVPAGGRERHALPVGGDRRIGLQPVTRLAARAGRPAHQHVLTRLQVVPPHAGAQALALAVRPPDAHDERHVAAVGGQRRRSGVGLDRAGDQPRRPRAQIAHVDVRVAVAAEVAGPAGEGDVSGRRRTRSGHTRHPRRARRRGRRASSCRS